LEENRLTEKTEEIVGYILYERVICLKAYPICLSVSSGVVRDAASPCSVRSLGRCEYSNP